MLALPDNSGYRLLLTLPETLLAVDVDFRWYSSRSPSVGGYYVKYADGYTSYSPAKAFEEYATLESDIDQAERATIANFVSNLPKEYTYQVRYISDDATEDTYFRGWNDAIKFVVEQIKLGRWQK